MPPSLMAHSDLTYRNIIIPNSDSKTINSLIDFGKICIKPKISDVSNAIKYFWRYYREENKRFIKAFLEGYPMQKSKIKGRVKLLSKLERKIINW